MSPQCRCGCESFHDFGSYIVTPLETLWFKSADHRDNYKARQYGVSVVPQPAVVIPVTAYY
jgi:hypothetical protein